MADPALGDIEDIIRITLVTQASDTNEESQFSFHTGNRNVDASVEDILDAAETLWDGIRDYYSASTLVRVTSSQWGDDGFTGWHQERARALSLTGGGAGRLPPQLALVVGYRCSVLAGVLALGRRRNRCYLGPLAPSIIDSDGLLDDTARTDITAAFVQLHSDLLGIANVTSAAFSGLVVASPTATAGVSANQISIGNALDTMRSRRQRVPEAPVYTSITPG